MIIVHDSTIKKYIYFDRIKRFKIFLKLVIDVETINTINSINITKFTCPVSFTNSVFSTNSVFPVFSVSPVNSKLFTNSILSTYSTSLTNSTFSTYLISFNNNLQQYIRKLYTLEHYNKEMSDLDNHVKLNSYYLISRYYHRRN